MQLAMTDRGGSATLEHFIPLSQAARQLALSQATLHALIESGKIRAAVLPGGEIGVSKQSAEQAATYEQINEQLRAIRREDFKKLRGRPITIPEAAEKYDVLDSTLRQWIKRGIVAVLESGYGKQIDEADVAYCAKIFHTRKSSNSLSGAPLLDERGNPQLLKHPQLSEYRRKRKTGPRLLK
jgi:hypothetical protein